MEGPLWLACLRLLGYGAANVGARMWCGGDRGINWSSYVHTASPATRKIASIHDNHIVIYLSRGDSGAL